MKKRLLTLPIALLALSNIMCGFGAKDFDEKYFTRTQPELAQLAGIYRPTEDTLKLVNETGHYNVQDISITLFANGTFEMINLPDWWYTDFGEPSGGTDSGNGKWSLDQQTDYWDIVFRFETTNFSSDPALSGGLDAWIELSGEQKPYSLWFYVGDPDDGRVMILQQIIEKSQ